MDHNNNPNTDEIDNEVRNVPDINDPVRDTTPIIINELDNQNILHMESETSPDLIKDFTENLEAIVNNQKLKERMNNQENPNLSEDKNKSILIKDYFLRSRYTKLFPHIFTNSACDYTHPRPRNITEREALDRILYN